MGNNNYSNNSQSDDEKINDLYLDEEKIDGLSYGYLNEVCQIEDIGYDDDEGDDDYEVDEDIKRNEMDLGEEEGEGEGGEKEKMKVSLQSDDCRNDPNTSEEESDSF